MNFDIDYRHIHVVRSPQAVPLLILVREWGKYREAAYQFTDVILLILKGIQPMASLQHGMVSEFLVTTTLYLKGIQLALGDDDPVPIHSLHRKCKRYWMA